MHAMLIDGNLAEIATAAAVLVVEQGLEYGPARHRALKVLGLPSRTTLPNLDAVDRAVREHLALFGAESQPAELAEMRSVALQWMERLAEFRPHLTGTVLAGTATRQSDICIQLYCDDPKSAEIALINWGIAYDTQTIRGFTGEPVDALSFVQFCSGLKAEVGVHLLIYDYDDLRASPMVTPAAPLVGWMADLAAPAPVSAPSPAQAANPFVGGVPVVSQPAFGGGSGTVAMDRVPSIPAMTSPPATAPLAAPLPSPMGPPMAPPMHGSMQGPAGIPGAPGSVGQAMASSLPSNAQVGKRTVALMIDQALAAQRPHTPSNRGLIVAVAALSVLVLAAIGAGAWYVLQRDDDRPARNNTPPTANDPSTAGARIAAANEGNIYLLAMRQPDGRVRGFCTGFSVNENTIATNAHCVRVITQETSRGASLVALRNKGNGEMIPATAVYLDARFQNNTMSRGGAGYDVGLVQTTARLPGWVTLSPDSELQTLREGDGVFVYGFPGMTMNERSPVATITLGLLNRVTDFYDNVATPQTAQKLQHSAQTSGGSSGSPIFLPSGTVIGVNAGSLSDDERQVVIDPSNGQRREVEVNRGSNFKYGMRSDLIRQAMASVNAPLP